MHGRVADLLGEPPRIDAAPVSEQALEVVGLRVEAEPLAGRVTAPNSGAAIGSARLPARRIIRARPIVPVPATFTAPGTGLRTAATSASSASSMPTSWMRGSKPMKVGQSGWDR